MNEVTRLWNRRAALFMKEVLRYFPLIFNTGTITFMVFGLFIGAFYYKHLLDMIPASFPVEWAMALVFSCAITPGPIRTFVREADLVFLLPAERRMGQYFRYAFWYSFVLKLVAVFVLLLMLWPLYVQRAGDVHWNFFAMLLYFAAIQLLNTWASWREHHVQERSTRSLHVFVRWASLFLVLAVLFYRQVWMEVAVISAVYVCLGWLIYRRLGKKMVNWQYLLEMEKRAQTRFYFFVSWFVDVPQKVSRVRRRSILSSLISRLRFRQDNTYAYLYGKALVRSELPGVLLRFSVVAIVLIWFIPSETVKLLLYALFLYMAGLQLSSLRQRHRDVFWFHIYPVPVQMRRQGLRQIVYYTMLAEAVVLLIPLLFTLATLWLIAIALIAGLAIAYFYSHKRLLRGFLSDFHT